MRGPLSLSHICSSVFCERLSYSVLYKNFQGKRLTGKIQNVWERGEINHERPFPSSAKKKVGLEESYIAIEGKRDGKKRKQIYA